MDHQIRRRDTISELPDDLLLKMLSCLPCKDAVATSALSKRWRSLWKEEVKIFRYGDEFPYGITISTFSLFITGRSRVDGLHLKLNSNFMQPDIKRLVDKAVARSLRDLRIEMLYNSLKFPESLYFYPQLEVLVLEKLSLVDVPPNVSLTGLKYLHLLSVKFEGDESVKTLLSICPRLEELVVRRSSYTNVMIFTIDVPTLRSLSIDNTSGKSRPNGVHGFVINAPSLRSFSIRDSFSNYLRFEDMPELVNARVNVVCDQPDMFLRCLASTQYLSLCSVTSQTPYPPTGPSFLSLDILELCSCSAEWLNLLTLILSDAPRLRVLKVKLFQKHCIQHDTMDSWNQPNPVPECLSSHLEIFEWRQYNGTEQEREAAKYILVNASRLKKARFYSESAERHGMLKELECVARPELSCTFVFTANNNLE